MLHDRSALAALLGIVFVAFGAAYCAAPRDGSSLSNEQRIVDAVDAENFALLPLYWVGSEFDGVSVDKVFLPHDGGYLPGASAYVTYGTCGNTFPHGCEPPLYIRVRLGCLDEPGEALVRGRTAHRSHDHLAVQAGEYVVSIYGGPHVVSRAVERLVLLNQHNLPAGTDIAPPGGDFPASLCEWMYFHPPSTRTPAPAAAVAREIDDEVDPPVETVFASFGAFKSITNLDDAERELGWHILRSRDGRYTMGSDGAIRVFKNTLGRVEQQQYTGPGRECPIQIHQEPESYPDFDREDTEQVQAGPFVGDLWKDRDGDYLFIFFSRESVSGQRIRVTVWGACGYTREELVHFVSTLE